MRKISFLLAFALISFAVFAEDAPKKEVLYFFYSDSCPHCHEAMPFVEELEKERPDIEFRKLEVSKSPENLAVFRKKMEKLGVKGGGVPTFIFKDKHVIGFRKGVFEEKIRAMIGKPVKKPVKK